MRESREELRVDAPLHLVALSGGKDSTALALRLKELHPHTPYVYFCTPTGDELPEMLDHWDRLEELLGQKIVRYRHKKSLNELIEAHNALPSFRMRWCTRQLKIEVAKCLYLKHPGSVVYVGLRADEESRRGGIYGDLVEQRYPLREWGWGIDDVMGYLSDRGVVIPPRTDCARCYSQRLGEWWNLWHHHPAIWRDAEAQETHIGHTFRSEARDTWPASLSGLRQRFEAGDIPRGVDPDGYYRLKKTAGRDQCRACSL